MSVLAKPLVQETAPAFASRIAQQDSRTLGIGKSGDGVPIGITKGVSYAFIRHCFSGAFPDIAKLVAQSNVIPVSVAMDMGTRLQLFKMKEAAGNFTVNPFAFIDHTQSMRRSGVDPNGVSALVSA